MSGGVVVSRRVGMSTGASPRGKAVPALGGTLSACYRHAVAHLPREDRRRTTPERRTGLLVRRVRRALRGIRNEQRWQICRDGGTGRRDGLKSPRGIRRNTMFPPALKGWNHPAPPVPRPRACPPPHPSRSRRAPTAPLKLSCLKPYTSGVSSALDARAWRNGRRSGLEGNLSARRETGDAELPKFGESCHMAIPSQARPEPSSREGVETRRAAPNPGSAGHGEGIVQTANPASAPGRRKP